VMSLADEIRGLQREVGLLRILRSVEEETDVIEKTSAESIAGNYLTTCASHYPHGHARLEALLESVGAPDVALGDHLLKSELHVQESDEKQLTSEIEALRLKLNEHETELKVNERQLGLITHHCEQLEEFMQNFDETGKNIQSRFHSPSSRTEGLQESAATTHGSGSRTTAANPLRAGTRKSILRRKAARRILKNKRDSFGGAKGTTAFAETPSIKQAKRLSLPGSATSVGSDGLTPKTRAEREEGYMEMMNAWRSRRGIWAWQRVHGAWQVVTQLTDLATDQWQLNMRLGYFLAFLEYSEALKEKRKRRRQQKEQASGKATSVPPRTPGTVAGRVKRDPRPSMTRTQRLQADKRRPPSSQSMRNNMQTPEIRKGRVAPTA